MHIWVSSLRKPLWEKSIAKGYRHRGEITLNLKHLVARSCCSHDEERYVEHQELDISLTIMDDKLRAWRLEAFCPLTASQLGFWADRTSRSTSDFFNLHSIGVLESRVGCSTFSDPPRALSQLMGLFGDYVVLRSHSLGRRFFLRIGAPGL